MCVSVEVPSTQSHDYLCISDKGEVFGRPDLGSITVCISSHLSLMWAVARLLARWLVQNSPYNYESWREPNRRRPSIFAILGFSGLLTLDSHIFKHCILAPYEHKGTDTLPVNEVNCT